MLDIALQLRAYLAIGSQQKSNYRGSFPNFDSYWEPVPVDAGLNLALSQDLAVFCSPGRPDSIEKTWEHTYRLIYQQALS